MCLACGGYLGLVFGDAGFGGAVFGFTRCLGETGVGAAGFVDLGPLGLLTFL